ncbi:MULTISPECIES: hypothetical protein [unclassified Microcoleus]
MSESLKELTQRETWFKLAEVREYIDRKRCLTLDMVRKLDRELRIP